MHLYFYKLCRSLGPRCAEEAAGSFYGTNNRTGQQNLKERGMSGNYWAESQIFSLASFDVLLLSSSLVISPSAYRLCSVEPLADMGFHLPGRSSDPDGVLRAESLEDCHRSFRRPSHPRTGVYFLLHHFHREICSQDTPASDPPGPALLSAFVDASVVNSTLLFSMPMNSVMRKLWDLDLE